ncbi:hypothetical protein BC628DRAFT_1335918 [Trametes gibbosa]|nr:hypothetical protein BC628DRAFT_1335918 [Trametes gibbosa]
MSSPKKQAALFIPPKHTMQSKRLQQHVNSAQDAKKKLDVAWAAKAAQKRVLSPGKPESTSTSNSASRAPPLSTLEMEAIYESVQEQFPGAERDRALGPTMVRAMRRRHDKEVRSKFFVQDVVIEKFCSAHKMLRTSSGMPGVPTQYKHHGRSFNVNDYPVVLFDDSSVSVSQMRAGQSGFAYMTPTGVASLPTQPFHLYKDPSAVETLVEHGVQFRTAKWRYCGIYLAHPTPYTLSQREIDHLMNTNPHSWAASVPVANMQVPITRAAVDTGKISLPLVLLECVDFKYSYAHKMVELDAQSPRPVQQGRPEARPLKEAIEQYMREDEELAQEMARRTSSTVRTRRQ